MSQFTLPVITHNESGGIRQVLDALLSLSATTLSHPTFEIMVGDVALRPLDQYVYELEEVR